MSCAENQRDEYAQASFRSNSDAIKDRFRFLLELHEDEDRLIPPDVWYCFEEARHTFMMGDYVASMIMCAVTVERHLAKLLPTVSRFSPGGERTRKRESVLDKLTRFFERFFDISNVEI